MYEAYIVEIRQIRPHSNADRLQVATFFGNNVCVDSSARAGDKGIYFPTDGQLSVEYCEHNNLLRKKDENGNNIGGYMDVNKRNVTTIKLRGEYSDGLYMPIESLTYTGVDLSSLKVGESFTAINGHPICQKYIPIKPVKDSLSINNNKSKKKKVNIAPLFKEHADTKQLAYNLDRFANGDQIEITLKMHGTSGRTAYLPKITGYKKTLLDKIFHREGKPIYEYGYVSGTRRTILSGNIDDGFYHDNNFRYKCADLIEGKLHKGETIYYEIVGYVAPGMPIMSSVSNKKINDKAFVHQYGETTTFSYGCDEVTGESDLYVYRMTMTNEDGNVVEYTPDFMRYRCEQMNLKTVPVFWKGFINTDKENWEIGMEVRDIAEQYYDGADPIGKNHVREGVVVRVVNRPEFCAYKHKNESFKILEGIVKSDAEAPDREEAQELIQN